VNYERYQSRPSGQAQIFSIDSAVATIGEIQNDQLIEQQFKVLEDGFSAVQIQFATFARTNQGQLRVDILDNNGILLYTEKIKQADIIDNAYRSFNFDRQAKSKNQTYKIQITAENTIPGASSTIWAAKELNSSQYFLRINGKRIPYTIVFKGFIRD
jgi:flagellar hook assembly protein FlgD